MITAQDLKGALAIMPTPAKEGAERLDATNTVDLDETARLAESLLELLDHMRRRGHVRIAHAEVDDVLAARSCRSLHRIHFGEDVGRQSLDAVEFFGHEPVMPTVLHCGKPSRCRRAMTSHGRSQVRAG